MFVIIKNNKTKAFPQSLPTALTNSRFIYAYDSIVHTDLYDKLI